MRQIADERALPVAPAALLFSPGITPGLFCVRRQCLMLRYNSFPFSEPETDMAKKRKRVAWSVVDVGTLKSMAKKKSPASKIAKALKRTEGATRQKAFSIGLSLETRG
jgi:hypothetical protein